MLLVGTLIPTFWISRVLLALLRRTSLPAKQQFLLGHAASLLLLAIFVAYVKVYNIYAPFIYIPGQLSWLVFDWFNVPQEVQLPARRRHRKIRSFKNFTIQREILLAVMLIVTIAFVGKNWGGFNYESYSYHDIVIGAPPPEVIYAVGNPAMTRNADADRWQPAQDPSSSAHWMYTNPFMVIDFNGNHAVENIVCTNDDKISTGACSAALNTAIGNDERALFAKLGEPTQIITTPGGKKIYRYPEVGHDFVLEQFYVRSIRVYPRNGDVFGLWWRFLIWLLP